MAAMIAFDDSAHRCISDMQLWHAFWHESGAVSTWKTITTVTLYFGLCSKLVLYLLTPHFLFKTAGDNNNGTQY